MPWTYSWVFRRWFLCPVKSVRELVFEAAGKECPPFAGMRQVVINKVKKHKSLLKMPKSKPKLRGTVETAAAEIASEKATAAEIDGDKTTADTAVNMDWTWTDDTTVYNADYEGDEEDNGVYNTDYEGKENDNGVYNTDYEGRMRTTASTTLTTKVRRRTTASTTLTTKVMMMTLSTSMARRKPCTTWVRVSRPGRASRGVNTDRVCT